MVLELICTPHVPGIIAWRWKSCGSDLGSLSGSLIPTGREAKVPPETLQP